MILNEEIRQEVISLLQGKIKGVGIFHNGRATFNDVETELPAVAVFIDEAEYQDATICDQDCTAYLKVGIYLPLFSTENELDVIANQIANILKTADLKTVDECVLKKYSYDYDATESAWKNATLNFTISYLN